MSQNYDSPQSWETHHPLMHARLRRLVSDSQVDGQTVAKTSPGKTNTSDRGLSEKQRTSVSDSQITYSKQQHATDSGAESPHCVVKERREDKAQGPHGMELLEVVKEKEDTEQTDVMQEFGHQLFDTAPYNYVQWLYNSRSREAIILVLASFFLYNAFRCFLQSMCEDGGFRNVFTNRDKVLAESARRIAMFSLRMLCVVITPLCLCVHISPIAAKPRIPKTSFSGKRSV